MFNSIPDKGEQFPIKNAIAAPPKSRKQNIKNIDTIFLCKFTIPLLQNRRETADMKLQLIMLCLIRYLSRNVHCHRFMSLELL